MCFVYMGTVKPHRIIFGSSDSFIMDKTDLKKRAWEYSLHFPTEVALTHSVLDGVAGCQQASPTQQRRGALRSEGEERVEVVPSHT